MKRISFLLLVSACTLSQVMAQTNTFPASGNVGVGTTTPSALFQVNGGNSQFGGPLNYARFLIDGDLTLTGTADYLVGGDRYAFRYSNNQNYGLYFSSTNSRFEFRDGSAAPVMWITGGGNIYVKNRIHIGSQVNPTASLEITPSNALAIKINPYGVLSGNTGEIRMMELAANGSQYTGFKASSSMATNVMYTLPIGDGVSGQILSTNGAGQLQWVGDMNNTYVAGGGLSLSGNVFANTAPDQLVTLLSGGIISISGTYPNFTISAVESDPLFNASPSAGINAGDIANWNAAYSWGDHAAEGYLTSFTETDPLYNASLAADINGADTSNWNDAYSWGDHADAGYLTSFTETDPIFNATPASTISNAQINDWNTAYGWGDHADAGYLTSYTETDPQVNSTNTNYVPKWNGTTLTDGLILDNGNTVGINTATPNPAYKLDVAGGDAIINGVKIGKGYSGMAYNTALGYEALRINTSGNYNTAVGWASMYNNTSGVENTGVGSQTLASNTSGYNNIAVGGAALYLNTIGHDNSATGWTALLSNVNGNYNTAMGSEALRFNIAGNTNTAMGQAALRQNISGNGNTSVGYASLTSNADGGYNSAYGYDALFYNTSGNGNTGLGSWALHFNQSGSSNTAVGQSAIYQVINGSNNTSIGFQSGNNNTSGSGNVFLGYQAGYNETGSNKLYIANSNANPPLIYGDFATAKLGLGTITPDAKLHVEGTVKIVDGTQGAGKVLTSDANGLASWQNVSYSESDPQVGSTTTNMIPKWSGIALTDGLIYDDGNNIGIGITSIPEEDRLQVQGNDPTGRIATFQNIYDEKLITVGEVLTDNGGYIKYKASTNYTGIGIHGHTEQLIVNGAGKVGIGTLTPTAKLDIAGDVKITDGTQGLGKVLTSDADGLASWQNVIVSETDPQVSSATNNLIPKWNGTTLIDGVIYDDGTNVGIGTTTPGYKLEVNADILVNGLKVGRGGGYNNTVFGMDAIKFNTGSNNTALGYNAMYWNNSGNDNTAVGSSALVMNMNGVMNSAFGAQSLMNNKGNENTAIGQNALWANNYGHSNTAIGQRALDYNSDGCNNTAIGDNADVLSSNLFNSTVLGSYATVDASNKVRIGNTSVTSIGGEVSWTSFSDERMKKDIRSDVPGLEFINALKPVTYHIDLKKQNELMGVADTTQWTGKYDIENISFTGFLAQDVEDAANAIGYAFSGIDKTGKLMGLRYGDFVVPLTQAVQELDATDRAHEQSIESLMETISLLQQQVNDLTAMINNASSNDGAAVITTGQGTGVAMLGQNVPNPYDQTTLIPFRIPTNCQDANIMITDPIAGRVITIIPISCNETHIVFQAAELPPGTYTYTLMIDGQIIDSKTMILTK